MRSKDRQPKNGGGGILGMGFIEMFFGTGAQVFRRSTVRLGLAGAGGYRWEKSLRLRALDLRMMVYSHAVAAEGRLGAD